jgi:multidrug efflux pump subunit AcrB
MWIVRVALQRPYTFIMLAVLIVLMGGYAISTRRRTSFRTSRFRSPR